MEPLSRTPLPKITTSDLSKRPGAVLHRIRRGERLIVVRHKDPVATLQPLDGLVVQPFGGGHHDIFGWPIGGIEDEVEKLDAAQRALLVDGYRDWRLRPTRLYGPFPWDVLIRSIEVMRLLGLATRTEFGWELTGRGLALREALMKRER